ncbi:MAG TPA: DUF1549 and DUF1553 domain-containing protein, partial [Gemmataceae bacterium]|nr:DUF1549 and DUF1553 domain-containing protein [Gemmataceae bacterium]
APLADDATFLRRAYLDLTGKIPPASEVRRFLRDPAPDKRRRAVERLLDSPGYVSRFTDLWRHLLIPEADNNFQLRYNSSTLDSWLRKQFTENAGYDDMVRELLTLPVGNNRQMYFNPYDNNGAEPTPMPFYTAKEGKPENLAATTARLFLGVRIECAQCHNHPFATWKREQFWGYAAFFGGIRANVQNGFVQQMNELTDRRELAIPGTDRVAQATFLDGTEPRWKYKVGARQTLADWMTAANNPFFARAGANRLWALCFGTGLVEPVDDFKDSNPPSHPELLDELARQFAAHHFDQKFLIRAITSSHAYQLSSVPTDPAQEDPRLFARMAVKGLTPEQLMESFAEATGYRDPTPASQRAFVFGPRNDLIGKFTQQDRLTEFQTSIPQALALMNSQLVIQATSPSQGQTLGAVLDAPFLDTRGRVETLFLATLSRKPTPEEAARLCAYVDRGGPKHDSKRALADVFWALLNSAEFMLNH